MKKKDYMNALNRFFFKQDVEDSVNLLSFLQRYKKQLYNNTGEECMRISMT